MRTDGCALVTGASRGIGAAIAKMLAAEGWPVGINFRTDEEGANSVVDEIEAAGGQALTVQGDVADPDAVDSVFAELEQRFGPVLVLVNNTGVRADDLSMQISDDEWEHVLATNLSGAFRMTRRALKGMMRARHGRVINISSVVGGVRGNPGQANYAASKAGLVGFTRTVAAEVARRNVTVNAVAPGLVETELTEGIDQQKFIDAVPARRAGTPQEIAAAVRFLASEDAAYITGITLTVDGGLTA